MMYFNFSKLFKLRGISKGTKFLEKHGLSYNQAYRMLYYRSSETHLKLLEKVCLALNCTPNDLIEWKPRTAEDDVAGIAL
jgi:DNA-binding Xre family transcriptional regulator